MTPKKTAPPAVPAAAPPPVATRPSTPPPGPALNAAPPSPFRDGVGEITEVSFSTGTNVGGQKILLYGPGGIGKSSLAGLLPDALFVDIEDGTNFLNVRRVTPAPRDWRELRGITNYDFGAEIRTLIYDSATVAQKYCERWVIENIKTESGRAARDIASYPYGKGVEHVYGEWLNWLSDLDGQVRRGKNVVIIAHPCTDTFPNAFGPDFIRYEPDMQSPKSGKNSIRNATFTWSDHCLFIGWDVLVDEKTNKATGSGSRTIYPFELPTHRAKNRVGLQQPIPFNLNDPAIWQHLGLVAVTT